jgi:two-component system response regulator
MRITREKAFRSGHGLAAPSVDVAVLLIVCGMTWQYIQNASDTEMAAADLKTLLGAAIKAERAMMGISQEELASRAGLHRTYVSDLERGVRNPSLESVGKLAQALELSVPMLFDRTTNGNKSKQLVEIVLVEYNPRDVDLTLKAFKRANITNPVYILRDGAEALDFIFATGPYAHRRDLHSAQIVLLDLNLAKIRGFEVLRKIKADKRTRNIPVIILTAPNKDNDIIICRRLGAEDYISKPVGFENFSEVTRHFRLGWELVKPMKTDEKERGGDG